MYFTVYKTTNLINGKYYIGAHKTNNPNDSYMGSGVALLNAMKKYGRENFIKEILFTFDNQDQMFMKEKELVEIGEHTYNIMVGGKGGWDHIDISGDKNPMKQPEVVERMKSTSNKRGSYKTKRKLSASLSNLEKAIASNIGRKRPEHSKLMKNKTKKLWAENKDKMRDSLSSWFTLTSPEGEVYETNRLEELCKSLGLPYNTVWKSSKTNTPPKRGNAKGWLCQKQ